MAVLPRFFCVLALLLATAALADPGGLPSEIPGTFTPVESSFDYVRRDAMIPMRDGVKLFTVILIPKGAQHAPILLTRTPYGAADRVHEHPSAHLGAVIGQGDVADELMTDGGYIRVFQDIRGKHGSEGDYVMNRPLVGPQNPTGVDHATDTYDTIDWLVKNTPESNGKVGMLGISYDGFTTLMGLFHPHPALKAVVPINAMVDGWMGDDWFHKGAFRPSGLSYFYEQEATRGSELGWWSSHYDEYDEYLQAGSAGDLARSRGLEQVGFYGKLTQHPSYDAFWQDQAVDKLLAKETITVPTLLVHSLWDQEDIYGNIAVWQAIKPNDKNGLVSLVLGPWFHHQERLDGSAVGPIRFGSDTAAYFREQILKPFFDRYLKDDAPQTKLPIVTAFETGTNRWETLPTWPSGCASGCKIEPTPIYLQPEGKLGFTAPDAAEPGFESYVSDPAKPVPFLPRPIHLSGDSGEARWQTWLTSDQRDAASRTDVLSFATEPLTKPVKLSGQPIANIVEATSGTDGDVVVKLIDVYPDEVGRDPALGGYQLMISADIMRGRYRESYADPKPIAANQKLAYRFVLPTVNHVFLPGHRIMVQVQSSWFPLYDRNPQTYVDNIFFAKPGDYRKAEIKLFDAGADASFVTLPVVH